MLLALNGVGLEHFSCTHQVEGQHSPSLQFTFPIMLNHLEVILIGEFRIDGLPIAEVATIQVVPDNTYRSRVAPDEELPIKLDLVSHSCSCSNSH